MSERASERVSVRTSATEKERMNERAKRERARARRRDRDKDTGLRVGCRVSGLPFRTPSSDAHRPCPDRVGDPGGVRASATTPGLRHLHHAFVPWATYARAAFPARPCSDIRPFLHDLFHPGLASLCSPVSFRSPRNPAPPWNGRIWNSAKKGDLKPSVSSEKGKKGDLNARCNIVLQFDVVGDGLF